MTVYLCLDDENGMLFNHRRQSRDAAVLTQIRQSVPALLTVDPFSEKLIREAEIPYALAPEDLGKLEPDAHFFSEVRSGEALLRAASTLVIFRWNRRYPADVRWNVDMAAYGFRLESTIEFPGTSHECITKEVYVR